MRECQVKAVKAHVHKMSKSIISLYMSERVFVVHCLQFCFLDYFNFPCYVSIPNLQMSLCRSVHKYKANEKIYSS